MIFLTFISFFFFHRSFNDNIFITPPAHDTSLATGRRARARDTGHITLV